MAKEPIIGEERDWKNEICPCGCANLSGFRNVARGLSWTLACQLIMSIGQLVYAGVTARIFSPAEFGGFAAALSLMGLLALLTTTGLPSFVLKESDLSGRAISSVRLIGVVGGLLSALVFVSLMPHWLLILKAPEGQTYLFLLALGQAIGPSSAIESALLRRELQPRRDALTLLLSFLLSSLIGLVIALATRDSWSLAVPVALQPAILGVSARLLQREVWLSDEKLRFRTVFSFSRKITAQNTGFYILQKVPEWVVSSSLGSGALGQFAKGSSLAQMPASALNSALNRAMQPYWRLLRSPDAADRALNDAAVLAAGLAFPTFGIVAANASAIVQLWLGEGWEQAGALATFMAIGAGLAVPFGNLANGQEMRGNFKHVRRAQWSMTLALIPPLVLLVLTRDLWWSAAAAAFSPCVGLLVMAASSGNDIARVRTRRRLMKRLVSVASWSAVVSAAGWAVGLEAAALVATADNAVQAAIQVFVASTVSLSIWLLTFRWHETNRVLRRRGFRVPALIGGRLR